MSEIKKLETKIQKTKKSAREFEEQLKSLIELRNYEQRVKEKENRYVPSNQQKQKVNEAGGAKYKCKANIENKQCEQRKNDYSPKKVRTYDVHEAREYIKRQRETRSQQNKVNEAKLKEELKKKKLQDLHEKAQELVLKNVQIHQQRSKSRDKEQYARIDGCNQLQKRSRSISRERNCDANQQTKSRIIQPSKEESKNKAVVGNVTFKQVPGSLLSVPSVSAVSNKASHLSFSPKEKSPKNLSFKIHEENSNNIHNQVENLPVTLDTKNITDKVNIISNITLKTADIKENKAPTTSNTIEVKQTEDNKQNILKFVPQTKTKVDYPIWLQETPELGHPLNFINTVKRKLQYVVSSPKANVDIGVQSSLREDNFKLPTVTNSLQEKKGNICDKSIFFVELSNTKSFHSHKHPNLDIKSVEHLELIPKHMSEKKSYNFDCHQNGLTENNISSKSNQKCNEESESDTSKNIPDISSESGTSLRKNAESVRRNLNPEFNLSIDSGKINQMKLVPKIKSVNSTSTIQSEIQRTAATEMKNSIQTSKKSGTVETHLTGRTYDLDFNSDNDSSLCLSKSRDSILSFNSPEYSRQVIIPLFPKDSDVPIGVASTSQSSLKCANQVLVSSSPKDQSALKTEVMSTNGSYKGHGGILNIPEVVISDHHTGPSRCSIDNLNSSLNSDIPSIIPNESYSSQFETSKSNSNMQNINTKRGSRSSSIMEPDTILSLEDPKGSLFNPSEKNSSDNKLREEKSKLLKNISLRARNMDDNQGEKQNEIHLKFEAEIHLLNDFNQSVRQFSAVEKVVETLKSKNELTTSNLLQNNKSHSVKINKELPSCDILQNKDTQTSVGSKTSSTTKSTTRMDERELNFLSKSKSEISSINYSRGSFSGDKSFENDIFKNSLFNSPNEKTHSQALTDLDTSPINTTKSFFDNNMPRLANFENLANSQFSGFSLKLFDQLIKDEDARLEHLKMILKIREKALLDRVRAELAWLEIQRKHYKETGNLQEVSVIKKKQRGILLNHQREKHEMQRVKQMQRAASTERKTILKEQRNLIKKQLSTDNMLLKMKVNTPRKRASVGPLKVIQSHTESIMSETSISKKSSTDKEEVYSMTSHHTVSRISEISEVEIAMPKVNSIDAESLKRQQHIKRTLLMREAALRKRRKQAEDLLQWNQKLLEEEKRINELELRATSIIHQQHNTTTISDEKHKFSGKELNKLWYNLTGCEENKFKDEKIYRMSQIALERFYKGAREYSVKTKKSLSKNSNSDCSVADISVSDNVTKTNNIPSSSVPSDVEKESNHLQDASLSNISVKDYSPDFEVDNTDNVVNVADIDVNENIDELIQNFSRIEDDISSLGSRHCHDRIVTEKNISGSPKSNKSDSEAEISVIETNKLVKNPSLSAEWSESLEKSQNNNVESITKNYSVTLIKEDIISTESLKSLGNKSKIITNGSVSVENQDNLNESKEILLILGESDNKINFLEREQACIEQTTTENVNTTEEILSTLNRLIAEVASDNTIGENSALLVDSVPFKDTSISTEKREDLNTSDNILSLVADQEVANLLLEEHCTLVTSFNELPEIDSSVYQPDTECLNKIPRCEDDKQNIIPIHKQGSIVENECSQGTDAEEELTSEIESLKKSDENLVSIQTQSKERTSLTNIDHLGLNKSDDVASASSFIHSIHSEKDDSINEINYKTSSTSHNLEENGSVTSISSDVLLEVNSGSQQEVSTSKEIVAQKHTNNSPSSVVNETEDFNEKSETSRIVTNSLISTESNEVQNEYDSRNKSDYERNEVPSISNTSHSSLYNLHTPEQDISVHEDINNLNTSTKTSPKTGSINIKKRVTEIMAEANQFSKCGDRSPRFQEIYTTTYDLTSPTSSPELDSPVDDQLKIAAISSIFDNEAEEILKKQLAIEQEIKQITEQQQKQQLPYLYVREIPNKPPPPYTPPSSATSSASSVVVIPSSEEIDEITKYSAKILHKAYLSNNLDNISVSDNTLKLITKDIPKEKYKFVFDLCKDISKHHYMQFEIEKCPAWLQVSLKPQLLIKKPFDVIELEKHISKKLREVFGYEKPQRRENSIIKWSRKKRDHVDEVLVAECQAEDEQWINYEKDELLVIDEVTNDIMNSLFSETADVISEIFSKCLQ